MFKTVCWLCYRVAAPSLKPILRYMATVHAYDPHFCGLEGCSRTYSNFFSFKKHVYRKHRSCLSLSGPFVTSSAVNDTGNTSMDVEEHLEILDAEDLDDCEEQLDVLGERENLVNTKFEYLKQMAIFLLKTKEVRKVSQAALEGLIADFTSMLQLTIHQIKCEVRSSLKNNGLSMSTIDSLEKVFHNPQRNEPFLGLETKFLQEKFYREHLNILVSYYIHFLYIATWDM